MMAAAIPNALRPRLGQFVRLLASDQPGEVVAAASALKRALAGVGADLNDLGDAIERPLVPTVIYRDRPATGDVPEWAQPKRSAHPRAKPGDVMLDFRRRCQVVAALRHGFNGATYSAWETEFVVSILGRLNSGNGRLTIKQAETIQRLLVKLGEGSAWE